MIRRTSPENVKEKGRNKTAWLEELNQLWGIHIGSRHLSEEEEVRALQVLDAKSVLTYDKVYRLYMTSKRWNRIKQIILNRDAYMCVVCGEKKHVQIDHITYHGIGCEVGTDLQVLCVQCHNKKTKNHAMEKEMYKDVR